MPEITITHAVQGAEMALGLVRAEGIVVSAAAGELCDALSALLVERGKGLDESTELRRKAARDMLRNGKYKPTGRGKPASEYLLRAVGDEFPRINGPVDANNFVSLRYMVPVSVWDLELAGCDAFEFRLGGAGEEYVFNSAGQVLSLEDLVCGCGVAQGESRPLVTPIKDGLATKIREDTRRCAGVIYFPGRDDALLEDATRDLAAALARCGDSVRITSTVLRAGQVSSL